MPDGFLISWHCGYLSGLCCDIVRQVQIVSTFYETKIFDELIKNLTKVEIMSWNFIVILKIWVAVLQMLTFRGIGVINIAKLQLLGKKSSLVF